MPRPQPQSWKRSNRHKPRNDSITRSRTGLYFLKHSVTSWAKCQHRRLESFRIDKDLAERETERGPVLKSSLPVFRGRDVGIPRQHVRRAIHVKLTS